MRFREGAGGTVVEFFTIATQMMRRPHAFFASCVFFKISCTSLGDAESHSTIPTLSTKKLR